MQAYEYRFPETDPFRAKEVTEPEFIIQSRKDWFEQLWIDFSAVRSNKQFERMKFDLGMIENKLENTPNDYVKIIFSGHRGCGKSVELKRFADEVNRKDAFFAVMIDLERETNIEQLEPEDLFVIIISVLIRELERRKIKFKKDDLIDIAMEWMQETELEKAIADDFGIESEAKASAGWNFWKFISMEGNIKGYYTRNTNTTRTIRQKIKTNTKPFLTKLNAALVSIRGNIRKKQQGKDIIFIIDGLEKANPAVYESLFIRDVQMITGINANLISTVPISTFYEILHLPAHDYFRDFYLPMVRVDENSFPLLKALIERRVDEGLFENGVLKLFIENSGGCPRILLKLVNRGILNAVGKPVTKSIAEEVLIEEGNERWRAMTGKHKDILRSGRFDDADKEVLELLQSLNLLEYNGMQPERSINPLIMRFIEPES